MILPGGMADKEAARGRSPGRPGTLTLGWIRWTTSSRLLADFDAPSATTASALPG